jgi:hypothetical protein
VQGRCDEALPVYGNAKGPLFIGDGDIDYICPKCFVLLCTGIASGDLAGVIVRCMCGTVGRVPVVLVYDSTGG